MPVQQLPVPQDPVQPVEIRCSESTEKAANSDEQTGAGAGDDEDMPETDDGAKEGTWFLPQTHRGEDIPRTTGSALRRGRLLHLPRKTKA